MQFWLAILILALPLTASPQAQQPETLEQEPIAIEARIIETTPPMVRAEGEVLFQQGQKRLLADKATYNYEERTGLLSDVTFTTCELANPDYRITANEIRLTQDQHLKLRRVRLYLWNLRILSLPRISINVGPGAGKQTLFPRPGYNSRDGFFLSSTYQLIETEREDVAVRIRPTTKQGFQGGIIGAYAIEGSTRTAPPFVPDYDTELRRGDILRPILDDDTCVFPSTRPQPPLLSAFGTLLVRERAYDIDKSDLLVSRLPEMGVRYVSPQVCVIEEKKRPKLGLQTEARASWGRFKEGPGIGLVNRWDVRGVASTTIATYRASTALQGAALARYSSYGNGDSYRTLGAALNLSRIFPGGSFASLRLISHGISGSTPFEFDDIDIQRELQAAGRYVRGRSTYSAILDYDLDRQSLRDWQFSFARRLHCIEPSITWRNRTNQISFGIRVLGL